MRIAINFIVVDESRRRIYNTAQRGTHYFYFLYQESTVHTPHEHICNLNEL
jgi:hypothetical protein